MTYSTVLRPFAAMLCFALATPLSAAKPSAETATPAPEIVAAGAADECRADLKTIEAEMEKDGYWRSGEGYGFGYPIVDAAFGMHGGYNNTSPLAGSEYYGIRPGHEVRVLFHAANIMARHGQQADCESILAQTRTLYKVFLDNMRHGGPPADGPLAWRVKEISAAVPVAGANVYLRSEQLLGVEVASNNGVALGSVDDLVLSPKTGQIAYLVIARGGILGFDQSHVPVPWKDFRATPAGSLLVLDTTNATLDGAPEMKKATFSADGDVQAEGAKVDAYWEAHPMVKASD